MKVMIVVRMGEWKLNRSSMQPAFREDILKCFERSIRIEHVMAVVYHRAFPVSGGDPQRMSTVPFKEVAVRHQKVFERRTV